MFLSHDASFLYVCCLLGVAQLCELRTSDAHPASNVAKQLCELCTSDTYLASNSTMLLAWLGAVIWTERFRTQWLEGGWGSGLQRKTFCINYMTFTCPVYPEPQDQTLQRRARVHDMYNSICNSRRKVFRIECYTRKYIRTRSRCQVQPLRQRDAHKFLSVGGKYYA